MSDLHQLDPANYKGEVQSYFAAKAAHYDDTDLQPYWVLSDRLLAAALDEHVLKQLPLGGHFLDAGGGTARWTSYVALSRPDLSGVLLDLTDEMMEVARRKAVDRGFADRVSFVVSDLADVSTALAGESFDLAFNFHNVLGFVGDPEQVVTDIGQLLAPGGLLVSFLPSAWHAAYFNISIGELDEAERALGGRGRFTSQMPDMHLFDLARIEQMHAAAGLDLQVVSGFPSLIYPGYQETQLHGSTESLVDALAEGNIDRVFALENSLRHVREAAARGNNLFVVARKQA